MTKENPTAININKNALIIIIGVIVIATVGTFVLLFKAQQLNFKPSNVISQDLSGQQILSMTAKAGFTPNKISAQANKSAILRITTQNTFDCSSSLIIAQLGIQKDLPPNGDTDIAIPPQQSGTKITGSCGMGMYGFEIEFL
jgi:plastocyanin domain-containing protein